MKRDIYQKLIAWECDVNMANEILQLLIEEKFIDNSRYAQFFVNDKFRFNKWGKIKLSYMLKQKNISGKIINMALEQIDETEYLETLEKLLQEKIRKIKFKNQFDRKAKLMRFAQSRGFESELVFKLIE